MQQQAPDEKVFSLQDNMFLKALKHGTATAHQALEDLPLSLAVIHPSVTKQDYTNYLLHMLAIVAELEQQIFPLIADQIQDVDKRRKLSWIVADLELLESLPPINSKSRVFPEPAAVSVAFGIGMMYVLEGSTLGGKFIGKNIRQALGYDASNGARYLAGYGADTGSMWKQFLADMVSFEQSGDDGNEIIEGANAAFQGIYHHLKG